MPNGLEEASRILKGGKRMSRIPKAEHASISFRGRASSEAQNRKNEEAYEDLLELFGAANELEQELEEIRDTFTVNKRFQHLYIQKLERQVRDLEGRIERRIDGETHHIHLVAAEEMRHDPSVAVNERAYIDNEYGVAHLPLTSNATSKLYLTDEVTGARRIPAALRIAALPASRLGARIEENDVKRAIDGDANTRWTRRVILPLEESPEGGVQTEVVITLPDTIISSRNVNLLTLRTFPVNSLQIDKVEYRLEGDWQLLPGWEVDEETGEPMPVQDAGNLKLAFPELAMGEVKVTMTQRNWFDENEEKVYHFGLEEFGVFHVDFQSELGRIDIPVTLRGASETKVLRALHPILANEGALVDGGEFAPAISYSIYTVDANERLHYTKDTFPVVTTHPKVLIRAVINKDRYNGATPVLKAAELVYDNVH